MLRKQASFGMRGWAGRGVGVLALFLAVSAVGFGDSRAQGEIIDIDLGIVGLNTMALYFPSIVHRPIDGISVRPGGDALGMGGAYLARAEGPLAVGWAPAGLAALDRTAVLFDGYQISSSGDASGYPDSFLVPQQPPLLVSRYSSDLKSASRAGFVGAATPLFQAGSIKVVGALSWRRFGEVARPEETVTDLTFGEENNFPVVFTVDRSEKGVIESFAPSLAVELARGISLGANLNFLTGRLRADYEQRLASGGLPLVAVGGVTFKYKGFVPDLGARISVMDDRVQLAAKFTPAYTLEVTGGDFYSRSFSLPTQPTVSLHGKMAGYDLDVPSALGAGIALRPFRRLVLAADFNVQNWSEAKMTYTQEPADQTQYETATTLPLDDVSTFHAGLEYLLFDWDWGQVPVRLGYHQVPLSFRQVDRADIDLQVIELPDGSRVINPVHTGTFNGSAVEADAITFGASLWTGAYSYDLGIETYSYDQNKWFLDSVYDPIANPRSMLVEHTRNILAVRLSTSVRF